MNNYQITGRLGQDAEHKKLDSGSEVLNFSVAIDRPFKNKDGEWDKKTQWHEVNYFAKNSEKLAAALTKGSIVQVEGVPFARAYVDKEDKAVGVLAIKARQMDLLHSTKPKHESPGQPASVAGEDEDDLPF